MKKIIDGKPASDRPTDVDIHVFTTSRKQGRSIIECMKIIGAHTKYYYDWIERGAHKDPDVHVKFPQCRKFYLAIKDIEQTKRGPKSKKDKPIQILPPPDVFEVKVNGVHKELMGKVLNTISTKMADGTRSNKTCDYCYSTGVHTSTPIHCSCVCHDLRDYLRA